jgi:hypothetical protein
VLIADAAQLRMRLQRAPVSRVEKNLFFNPAQWFPFFLTQPSGFLFFTQPSGFFGGFLVFLVCWVYWVF